MLKALFSVYVLRNPSGRLYIGQTQNLEQRLQEHRDGLSRWTSNRRPWELVFSVTFVSRSEAMRRERALKSGHLHMELRKQLRQPEWSQPIPVPWAPFV